MEANVTAQMNQILSEYGEEVEKLATEEFEAVAKETVNELKSTSPRRTGAYASSCRKTDKTDVCFFVHFIISLILSWIRRH